MGTREFVLNGVQGRHATFLRRIPALQGSVCVAPPAVLWRCASQLFLGPSALSCPTLSPPSTTTRSGNVSVFWWVWTPRQGIGVRAKLRPFLLEARSTLGQLGRQHENDHGTPPGSCTDHFACDKCHPLQCRQCRGRWFRPPSWEDLASGAAEEVEDRDGEVEPNQPRKGWQSRAARAVESRRLHAIREAVPSPQQALLRSQGGPLASTPFVSLPVDRAFRIDSQPFRILFLRRLRMPLLLTAHSCWCSRLLDSLGHHRFACPVAGVLGRRGFPLENAAARICREAGGRVRTNVLVQDLDLHAINNFDSRRLQVIVDGLSLFRAPLW